jgi:hypothetical protein
MIKKIAIENLIPGMFVHSVTKQQGQFKIKNQGWVRTPDAIAQLRKAGILEIEIDTDKTLPSQSEETAPTAPQEQTSTVSQRYDPTQHSVSVSSEIGKAEKLYTEAKSLQEKAIESIRAGKKLLLVHLKRSQMDLLIQFLEIKMHWLA